MMTVAAALAAVGVDAAVAGLVPSVGLGLSMMSYRYEIAFSNQAFVGRIFCFLISNNCRRDGDKVNTYLTLKPLENFMCW